MFTWDEAKNKVNIAKHRLSFDAAYEFDDASLVRLDRSREKDGEPRLAAIGYLGGKLHTMIYTRREKQIRIISLRRSNTKEEKIHAQIAQN